MPALASLQHHRPRVTLGPKKLLELARTLHPPTFYRPDILPHKADELIMQPAKLNYPSTGSLLMFCTEYISTRIRTCDRPSHALLNELRSPSSVGLRQFDRVRIFHHYENCMCVCNVEWTKNTYIFKHIYTHIQRASELSEEIPCKDQRASEEGSCSPLEFIRSEGHSVKKLLTFIARSCVFPVRGNGCRQQNSKPAARGGVNTPNLGRTIPRLSTSELSLLV